MAAPYPRPAAAALVQCREAESAFRRGDFERAETQFRECLKLFPGHPEALHGLAFMAFSAGALGDAAELLEQTVRSQPRADASWLLLARVRVMRREGEAARAALQQVRRLRPTDPAGPCLAGDLAQGEGRILEAHTHYCAALDLDPRHAEALVQRRSMAWLLGRTADGFACARRLVREYPESLRYRSELITGLCDEPDVDEAEIHRVASAWGRLATAAAPTPARPRTRRDRPRLGVFASTFHEHVIGRFLLPLLEHWPYRDFDGVHLLSDDPLADEFTLRYRALASSWTELAGLSDEAAAARIAAADLDILIDINGHFDRARLHLLAGRPAPMIVHYLGGACTSGLPAVTHRISDAVAEPPGESDRWSTEKIIRLPRGFHTYRALRTLGPVVPPPCLARGGVTFGTMASLHKLNPKVLSTWGELLRRVPGSRLFLAKEVFADADSRTDVLRRLEAGGIPRNQLALEPASRDLFRAGGAWAQIDVALDTFPYNGVTTTCEALSMGVPVVTLHGGRLISRTCASLLTTLGRPEWIASDLSDYLRIAISLAGDPRALADLRAGLREEFAASTLGQPAVVARDLADALIRTYREPDSARP